LGNFENGGGSNDEQNKFWNDEMILEI